MSREQSTELRDARKRIRFREQEDEVLSRAAAYLSHGTTGPGPMGPHRIRDRHELGHSRSLTPRLLPKRGQCRLCIYRITRDSINYAEA